MAGCKLTKSLDNKDCDYAVAGARALYLANYYGPVTGAAAVVNQIAYQTDVNGYVDTISLPGGEMFYKMEAAENTLSFSDTLVAGGNGAKYRQHTVNAVLKQHDIDALEEADALSLGRFIAVVIDNAGRPILLGRTGGLKAPAGGFDYNSGAAEADAAGWTVILQGVSTEVAPILKDETVVTPVQVTIIVTNLANTTITDVAASDKVTWTAVPNATAYDVYADGVYKTSVASGSTLEYSYAGLGTGNHVINVVPQGAGYGNGASNVLTVTL